MKPSNLKKKWMILLLLSALGCSRVYYTVAMHRDPDVGTVIPPAKYFLQNTAEDEADKIVEKKILKIVRTELDTLGWQESSKIEAEYFWRVEFGMTSAKQTYSNPVTTTYDKKGKADVTGGDSHSYTTYQREVRIVVDSKNSQVIWVADCRSEGTTPDVFYVAKYMVPFAIKKFPNEGIWKKKKITGFF